MPTITTVKYLGGLTVALLLLMLFCSLLLQTTRADIPVHCVHDDIANNEWKLSISPSFYSIPSTTKTKISNIYKQQFIPLNCTRLEKDDLVISKVLKLSLEYPNIVRQSADTAVNNRKQTKQQKIVGTWTMVYDQGFEITLKNIDGGDQDSEISLFAFSYFERMKNNTELIKSKCHLTFVGNYRKSIRKGNRIINSFGCFHAEKTKPLPSDVKISLPVNTLLYKYFDPKNNGKDLNVNKKKEDDLSEIENVFESESDLDLRILRTVKPSLNTQFKNDKNLIDWINTQSDDLGWTAQAYPHFEEMTESDLINLSGGSQKSIPFAQFETTSDAGADASAAGKGKPGFPSWWRFRPIGLSDSNSDEMVGSLSDDFSISKQQELLNEIDKLPKNFDWSNVDGVNYIPNVKNQKACGSCYAFAAVTAIESRIRIQTRNAVREPLAVQDIVSCSPYAQGCSGGIPYAVGRHLRDFTLVPESCFPYRASGAVACSAKCKNPAYVVKVEKYNYVSDYYGGSNYANMMKEIYENGPISGSYLIYPDFKYYKSGVYKHSGHGYPMKSDRINREMNGWEPTTHSVVITGWGEDSKTGEKYWNVLNSWSEMWGENGRFRIKRGSDECAIEAEPVAFYPKVIFMK